MIITYDHVQQRSDEWHKLRQGRLTCSYLDMLMNAGPKGRANLLTRLHAERSDGYEREEGVVTQAMQDGINREPLARAAYTELTGNPVRECGFIVHADYPDMGYSPDGIVGDGLLEIKCPQLEAHNANLALAAIGDGTPPRKHQWQLVGAMMLYEAPWIDFFSWHPDAEPALIRVNRNLRMEDMLKAAIADFLDELMLTAEEDK